MICCLTALSRGTRRSPGVIRPGGCTGSRMKERGLATRADVCVRPRLQDREQLTGPADVLAHLLHEGLYAVETDHPSQAVGELYGDVLAVEIEVGVEDMGLDASDGAVERRVGPDGDGAGKPLAGSPALFMLREAHEVAGIDTVAGHGHPVEHVEVRGRVAELLAARVTTDDRALDAVRPAQRLGGGFDVTVGQPVADERR